MSSTKKVVINKCFGGFGVSKEAIVKLREMGNVVAMGETLAGEVYDDGEDCTISGSCRDISREDGDLIDLLERMDSEFVSGRFAALEVVEIPSDVEYTVEYYDGLEHIVEVHRIWE